MRKREMRFNGRAVTDLEMMQSDHLAPPSRRIVP